MRLTLLVLNALVALAQILVATIAVVRPSTLSHSHQSSEGELFYSRLFGSRTIPFAVAIAVLPFYPAGLSAVWLLITAAAVQILDVIVGVSRKERIQILLASIAALVHALCAAAVLESL